MSSIAGLMRYVFPRAARRAITMLALLAKQNLRDSCRLDKTDAEQADEWARFPDFWPRRRVHWRQAGCENMIPGMTSIRRQNKCTASY
jgi:hypothetical protein